MAIYSEITKIIPPRTQFLNQVHSPSSYILVSTVSSRNGLNSTTFPITIATIESCEVTSNCRSYVLLYRNYSHAKICILDKYPSRYIYVQAKIKPFISNSKEDNCRSTNSEKKKRSRSNRYRNSYNCTESVEKRQWLKRGSSLTRSDNSRRAVQRDKLKKKCADRRF